MPLPPSIMNSSPESYFTNWKPTINAQVSPKQTHGIEFKKAQVLAVMSMKMGPLQLLRRQ